MPKRAAVTQRPEITLDQRMSAPLYRQLYERLRTAILTGQLEPGARLPSTRGLASELGVSRNTTALAYELLLLEGYLESRVGNGTRVAQVRPGQRPRSRGSTGTSGAVAIVDAQPVLLSRRGQLLVTATAPGDLYADQPSTPLGMFRTGQPDVTAFPYATWATLVARHARHSLPAVARYQDAQGYAPLREAIAAHIGITRGVRCSPDQVLLTAGSQGALDLVARALLDAGGVAWVEDPGYPGARGALLAAGATLAAVPVDGEGIDVAVGRQSAPDARLAVVTPSHQFPTGVTMSLNRRLALLEWARVANAWIVEDDYDSEYRYSGRPLEALQGLDGGQRVVYIGTFSKVLFPSLRLGYVVAPSALLPGLMAARRFIDVHPPLLEQLALAAFLAEGHFARHLRRMRQRYLERRNALVAALAAELGDLLEVAVPEAGLHLAAWLPLGMRAEDATRQAAARGLHVAPIVPLNPQPPGREGLMLGFAAAPADELRTGVRMLARALLRKE